MGSVRVENEDKIDLEYPAGHERPHGKASFPLPNFSSKGRSQLIGALPTFTCRLVDLSSTESEVN